MNNIKALREQRKMTQQDCANIFGVTLRAWQTYEQGVSEPKFNILFKIADYFNVSLDYLLGRAEPKNPLLEMAIKPINDDEMWATYEKLPDIAKEIFVEVMNILVKASRKKESKNIEQNVYPIPTLARDKKGTSVEYMTEEEINDILLAEDADEDL